MYNKVILIGNLGSDPEFKTTTNGKCFAVLNVATSRFWKAKDGEKKEQTDWHRVTVYGDSNCAYLERTAQKGSLIFVEGQLRHNTRVNEETGQKTRYTDVVVSDLQTRVTVLRGRKQDAGYASPADVETNADGFTDENTPDFLRDDNVPF